MADKDLMTLGFGFDSKNAISGLENLEAKLNSVEKKYSNIKTRFEEGFNLKADTGSFEKISTAVKSMADNSAGVRSLANSLKIINQQLPKFSPEKFAPLSPAMISSVREFSLASNAAANSVKQIVGREFISQMALARQEMARLNAGLLHVAKSGRAVREALVGIPGMLNRLSGEKVKVITPEAIASMRKYGAEVRAAASEIRSLQGFTGRIRQGSGSVSSFGSVVSGAAGSVRSLGSELLNIATMTSLPMFFRNAAREAVGFGAELAQIESLTLDFSADKLRKGLLALPSAFGDARKNANALYYAYSSGVSGSEKELIEFTGQISKLSQVIRANQTDTVNAVTSAFNAYNLSVKNAAEVSDLFYAIVKRGKATGSELATGLGQVIPTAATAGLTLNEMGAAITSLTKVMKTRNAITYFNNLLSKMIKPTKESRLEAKKLGVELGLDALRAKGFAKTMEELRQKTLGNQAALLKIFPDLRGQRAALQLLNKGWDDFQSQLSFFEKKAGVTEQAFEKLSESLEYQLAILPQTFSKIRIATGEVMVGILTLGGVLEPVLRGFNNMSVTGQRVIGTLTLMAAVYGLLRAKGFLLSSVQGVEIRHQQLLSALRARELAERGAVTTAVTAQASATATLTRQQRLQVLSERTADKARLLSLAVDEKRLLLQRANLTGNLAAKTAALKSLRQAEAAFIIAENRNMKIQNALLKENIGLKAVYAKSNIFGAKGFSGGFKSAGGMNALTAMFTLHGIASSKRILVSFRRGLFSFGKILGGVLSVVSKIFNPLTFILAGVIGFIDILSSKGDTYLEKVSNSAVGKIGNALYDFFTGAITEAERLSKFLDDQRDAKLLAKNMRDIAKGISSSFTIAGKNNDSFKTQVEVLREKVEDSFSALKSAKMSDMIREYNKVTSEIEKFGNLKPFNMSKAIARANEYFGTNFSADKLTRHALSPNDPAYDVQQYIYKEKKAYDEKIKSYDELRKRSEELSGKITPALEAFRRNGESWVSFWSRQKTLLLSIPDIVEKERFALLKPAEKLERQYEYIKKYQKEYEHALKENNGELVVGAVEGTLKTYGKMLQALNKEIKDFEKFSKTLEKDIFNAFQKSFDTPAKKIKALNDRANQLLKESGVSFGQGKFTVPKLENSELEKSYSKAKNAIELEIKAAQEGIKAKKKLADAEKRANSKTVDLIRTFTKFKATAAEAVDAFSVEAIKLQSRAFADVPKIKLTQTAQSGLQGAQAKVSELYAKMAQLADSFRQEVESRKKKVEDQKTDIDSRVESYLKSIDEAAKKAADTQKEQIDKLIEDARKIEEKFGRVEENSKRTADNTGKTAKVVGNLSTVMIG